MNTLYFKNSSNNIVLSNAQEYDFMWLDSTREEVTENTRAWQSTLKMQYNITLDELHVADILNPQHPSFFDLTNDYEILIFRKLLDAAQSLNTTPVSFVLTEKALITVHDTNSQVFNWIRQRISPQAETNHKLRLPLSPLDLCLRILNAMIDKYLELRIPLTQGIERWQNELLQGSHRFNRWSQLLEENLKLQQLENLCEEQLDALQELRDNYIDQSIANHTARRDLVLVKINDLVEHVTRVQNHASRLEESLKSAIDLHFSATANQTNETMRFLAILTAIFAPLTLLTGIYGMNFDIIPGLHNPNGFWILLVGMFGVTLTLLYYLRRKMLVGRGNKSISQLLSNKTDLS